MNKRWSVVLAFILVLVGWNSVLADTTIYVQSEGMTLSGTWSSSTNGGYNGNTASYSGTTNNYAEYTFTGNQIFFYVGKFNDRGKCEIFLDGVSQGVVDTYSASVLYQQVVYSNTGLSNASHTIKLVVTGTKNASSSNYFCLVDYLTYNQVSPTNTPTSTVTLTPSLTFTPSLTSTFTLTPSVTVTPSFTPSFTLTPSLTPSLTFTATETPVYTPTFTLTPSITPTPTDTGFPVDIGMPYYLLLILPLLFIDWQVALIWALVSLAPGVSDFFVALPFQGFELWIIFLVVAFMRRFFFTTSR